jgi:hypothetical protein
MPKNGLGGNEIMPFHYRQKFIVFGIPQWHHAEPRPPLLCPAQLDLAQTQWQFGRVPFGFVPWHWIWPVAKSPIGTGAHMPNRLGLAVACVHHKK